LVALPLVQDLSLFAKYLFIAAILAGRDNRVWLVLPTKTIEITHCSYVIKLTDSGTWDVEQFRDRADAEAHATTRPRS
jgi:hypothetical protein